MRRETFKRVETLREIIDHLPQRLEFLQVRAHLFLENLAHLAVSGVIVFVKLLSTRRSVEPVTRPHGPEHLSAVFAAAMNWILSRGEGLIAREGPIEDHFAGLQLLDYFRRLGVIDSTRFYQRGRMLVRLRGSVWMFAG